MIRNFHCDNRVLYVLLCYPSEMTQFCSASTFLELFIGLDLEAYSFFHIASSKSTTPNCQASLLKKIRANKLLYINILYVIIYIILCYI